MNIYSIFTVFIIVFTHLLQTNDRRALVPLLNAPEYDTTYSICYIITPPSIPFTIDPSPPVLAPPFYPSRAPAPPHTFIGATSTGSDKDSFSVHWAANLLMVIISGLLVHEVVAWLIVCTGNRILIGSSSTARDSPRFHAGFTSPVSPPPPFTPPSSPLWSLTNDSLPEYVPALPFNTPATFPDQDSDRVSLSSRRICASAPSPMNIPTPPLLFAPTDSDTPHMVSASSMPSMHTSSSLSDDLDDRSNVLVPYNDNPSSTSTGSMASVAARSVQNFLDDITLAFSPSPSFVIRTPPAITRIPKDLWEELIDAYFTDKPSVWDCYPQATPRTPVDLDDEVPEVYDEAIDNDVESLVLAWTINTEETPAASTSTVQYTETVEPVAESTDYPHSPRPSSSTRIPKLAPTPVWKKTINGLISGGGRKTARPKLNTPKKIDWFEDVEHGLSTSEEVSTEAAGAASGVSHRVTKACDRVFEKCDCALESALFEPKSWNKFKIPTSCRPRPSIHFFAPRDTDMSTPSTRIVVDNVNAFRHRSTEPNMPYANKDIEDLFYPAGAKNVLCFDGRIVGGVVRYNTSYAVVDFETIGDAEAAFKTFQGRKAYPDSYHLRLAYVDVNDRTFGRRMAVSMGPMERSEEERRGFAEFVEDLDRVDVDLAKVVLPSRPGFILPARPVTPPRL